jgi:hypothetical protein
MSPGKKKKEKKKGAGKLVRFQGQFRIKNIRRRTPKHKRAETSFTLKVETLLTLI